jgi:hypothetical protein
MMHKDSIRFGCHSRLQQIERSRHATDEGMNVAAPFHLQAIWAIIMKAGYIQQLIQVIFQLVSMH